VFCLGMPMGARVGRSGGGIWRSGGGMKGVVDVAEAAEMGSLDWEEEDWTDVWEMFVRWRVWDWNWQ
jgi:hypothetical protein